jgi:hypothetical protein
MAALRMSSRSQRPLNEKNCFFAIYARLNHAKLLATSESTAAFYGDFTSESKSMLKRVGAFLSGDHLYLFTDGSYLYVEWADVQLETIYDRGRWEYKDGNIILISDQTVPGFQALEDRTFLPIEYKGQLRLLGSKEQITYFQENAGDDPELMLMICSREKVESFTPEKSQLVQARLLKEAWRPDAWK